MRTLFITLFTFCCVSSVKSQVYDSVEFKKISINGIVLGSTKTALVKKLGKAIKVVTTEDAKGMDSYSDYHYGKSSVRISPAGIVNGFKITDDYFSIQINRIKIKVGDPLQLIAGKYPNSTNAHVKDTSGKFKLRIKASNSYVVCRVMNGLIKEMEIREEQP